MAERVNNYTIQMNQAKKHFLTYDQQKLIHRCGLRYDEDYLYFSFLAEPHRICRKSGDLERFTAEKWIDANSFNEVLTVLDWLCDSSPDRYITGRWVNIVSQGPAFHQNLQEGPDRCAELFERNPELFRAACLSLGGEEMPGADMGYAVDLVDGLRVLVQLWIGDEEFPSRVRCLWDENTTKYIRYETTWYATALLMSRITEKMSLSDGCVFQ